MANYQFGLISISIRGAGCMRISHGAGYIKHLDGLRALAVLLVIVFHADVGVLKGGFIGVDIFFVLSGFLICKVLGASPRNGRWLRDFYLSRFRRIVPIYLLMMGVVAASVVLLFLPSHLEKIWPSFFGGLFFLSNLVFWKTTSYFSPDLAYNPILHSWSLAVEWQFYAVAPLLFVLGARSKGHFKALVFFVFFGSLFVSIGLIAISKPTAAFYLLPSRLWEFMVGFLAAQVDVSRIPDRWKSFLSWLAISVILACASIYSHGTDFPGLAAIPVTLASAVLITCGASGLIGSFLRAKVATQLGQASYSIYIWHWPLIVLLDYRFQRGGQLPELERFAVILLVSLLVGLLSWKYIETPWRDKVKFPVGKLVRHSLAVAGGVLVVCCLGVAGLIPSPFSKGAIVFADAYSDVGQFRGCLKNIPSPDGAYAELCKLGDASASGHDFLLIGDSHAAALADGISLIASEKGKSGRLVATDACPPFVDFEGGYAPSRAKCRDLQRSIISLIKNYAPEKVLLHAAWGAYQRRDPERFRQQLALVAKEINALGVELVVIGDTPGYRDNAPIALAKAADFEWVLRPYSLDEHNRFYSGANSTIVEIMRSEKFKYFDFSEMLCLKDRGCALVYDGYPLYWDNAHLSGKASVKMARVLQKELLIF